MLARLLVTLVLLVCGVLPAAAQDRFILVIDGSSSMWGEVGGETKIEVLRRSLAQVLGQLDTTADVGVVAFGHREKGNCADIEELVPPQPFDAELIQAAIDSIQPKGKTPLSDAVRFAAEEMRFTEEKATVVILGDGGENCARDPCAVAEDLEKTGVDLTVHAIAFDIADEEGSAQLQCFAAATGGLFLPVADAPELVAALETVQKVVETPKPSAIRLEAVDQTTGAVLDLPVAWTLTDRASGQPQAVPGTSAAVEVSLMQGDYDLQAVVGEVTADAAFSVGPGQPSVVRIAVPQPVPVVLQPTDPASGAAVDVALDWVITEVASGREVTAPGLTGPVEIPLMPGDYRASVSFGGTVAEVAFSVGQGFPVTIPIGIAVPKPPQVRLVATSGDQPVAGPVAWTFMDIASFAAFDLEAETGTVSQAVPPGQYQVTATAPGLSGTASVAVAETGTTEVAVELVPQKAQVLLTALDASTGAPVAVDALTWTFVDTTTEEIVEVTGVPNGGTSEAVPPGTYDVIVEAAGGFGEAQVTVSSGTPTEVLVTVAMPEAPLVVAESSVAAGSPVHVRWNFDGRASDLVFILPATDADNSYPLDDWRRHEVGTTREATLTAPAVPGEYQVRYLSPDAGGLVHRATLWVLSPEGGLTGPGEAVAGDVVDVSWTGPGLDGDFLFVAPYDWEDNVYPMSDDQRVPVTAGNPARVPVPEREGQYEYRYFSSGGGGVLFRAALSVVAPGARVSAPASVVAGTAFQVEFSGPRDAEDRLFIAAGGSEAERYPLGSEATDRVQGTSPALLVAPVQPGSYEVRYYSLNKGGVLAFAAFEVTEGQVEIDAPRLVQRASDLSIRVKGPRAPGDIVFVAPKDWDDNSYPLGSENQLAFGADGDGVEAADSFRDFTTVAPAEPGTYEIRYFSWANGAVLERRALIVK
jgi:Ca-activated chloride channel family protein